MRADPPDSALTAAFVLAAACCRWPPSEVRDAVIRDAAADLTDWNDFVRQVERHRVAGLAYEALSVAGVAPPTAVAQELKSRAQGIARQNLILAGETVRLQRALAAADIPALALKGIALAALAYGSLATKDTRDIDLLVAPEHIEAALVVLGREGYSLSYPAEHLSPAQRRAVFQQAREVTLIRRGTRLVVELQWRLANNPLLLEELDVRSPSQDVAVADRLSVRTLAHDALFAYLCVHCAQHAWSRLKWLADLNAILPADGARTARLYRYAQSVGAGICAGQSLLLCKKFLGTALPRDLADELLHERRLVRLSKLAVNTMLDPRAEAEPGRGYAGKIRGAAIQFLLGRGWSFFLIAWRVETMRVLDVAALPLPRRLHSLYPLIRLPLWLWRRLSAAIVHWGS